MARLRLAPAERGALEEGARELGIELDSRVAERLADYADLLDRWSARTNLISCASAAELVERHLLDSLTAARLVAPSEGLVDLGSGAGLPGVPLAIVGGGRPVTLVESRRRRANFLRTVKRELGLDHVAVLEQRAEDGPGSAAEPAGTVICRAVWSGAEIFSIALQWVRPRGRLLWMRAAEDELEAGAGFEEVSEGLAGGGEGRRRIRVFERSE